MTVTDQAQSFFPDVNTWFALANENHTNHGSAVRWFLGIAKGRTVAFCTATQMSLLRLLTQRSAMGASVKTQRGAWKAFDRMIRDVTIKTLTEPEDLDIALRRISDRDEVSPQRWTDDYLAAFAETGGLILVTFDQALAARVANSVLLRP